MIFKNKAPFVGEGAWQYEKMENLKIYQIISWQSLSSDLLISIQITFKAGPTSLTLSPFKMWWFFLAVTMATKQTEAVV